MPPTAADRVAAALDRLGVYATCDHPCGFVCSQDEEDPLAVRIADDTGSWSYKADLALDCLKGVANPTMRNVRFALWPALLTRKGFDLPPGGSGGRLQDG